jgi:hypothetical protein
MLVFRDAQLSEADTGSRGAIGRMIQMTSISGELPVGAR